MGSDAPVNPAEVPVFTGNLETLEAKVTALSGDGTKVATAASDVHTAFGGLRAYYQAPEAEQLFATTQPVVNTATTISSETRTLAGALGTYARDIRPLVARLNQLRADAAAFRDRVAGDDTWREDGDLIEENLNRRNEIAEVWTQFQAAERTCHAKIVGLVGGTALKVNDGSNGQGMYGYDAEALKQSKSLPWGDAVQESTPWWQVWEHAWDFGKGVVVDGLWGTIKGLGTLVGVNGWDAAGQAWVGLGKLATGLSITLNPALGAAYWLTPEDKLPSWLRDSRTAVKETGKALLAWDQWEENPSRAAGAVTFNVLTTVFTGGAGGAVSGAGKAGAAARVISLAGKAGRALDPATYLFKGASMGVSKIGDVLAGLRGMGRIDLPAFPEGTLTLPEGSFTLPDGTLRLPEGAAVPPGAIEVPAGTVRLPEGTEVPAGAVDLGDGMVRLPEGTPAPAGAVPVPEGTVKLPENAVTLPEGTVKLPEGGPAAYMDLKGNLYGADGALLQNAKDAPTGNPAADADTPRVETPVREPALVGAGARIADNAGNGVVRLGDGTGDLGDVGRVGDDVGGPGGRAGDNRPGGVAGNLPANNVDNNIPGGTGPGTGGLDNNLPGGGSLDNTIPSNSLDNSGTGALPSRTDGPGGPLGGGGLDDLGRMGDDVPDGLDDLARTADEADRPGSQAGERTENGGTGSNDVPAFKDDPRKYTDAERQAIMEWQVKRANTDPQYFKDYYQKNGYRHRVDVPDESGLVPPQLIELPGGRLVPKSDLAPPLKPSYLDELPVARSPDTASKHAVDNLNEMAKARHDAIAADKPFHTAHGDARAAYKENPTDELKAVLDEAAAAHKGPHAEFTKASEAYGEAIAREHMIPDSYPGATELELHGPKNGKDQFDQVWKQDNRYIVVEAKSHVDTPLGERTVNGARHSQGSRPYFLDILEQMKKRGRDPRYRSDWDLAKELKTALDEGRLEYVAVKGKDNAGTYTGYTKQRFDIREPE